MSLKQTATLNETFRITDKICSFVHWKNVDIKPLSH